MANLLYPASSGHTVDDKYSALVEPNLFAANVFQPGVTYTDKYQIGPAGQIMVHKPGIGTITPTVPGADFSDAIVQDSLITIILDKQFSRSRKMYKVAAESVAYAAAAVELELALAEVRAAWNLQAVKSLIGTTSILVSDNILTVAATDGSDIYDQIVNDRKKLRNAKARPNVLIVSPATYAKLLKAPEFQRSVVTDDSVIRDASVGRVAGMNVYEYESLDDAAVDAATIGGITWATADELEYIMYDSDAFSIVTSIETVRVKDSERFNGSLAQVEVVSGYKLTNPSRALLKFHDASATE